MASPRGRTATALGCMTARWLPSNWAAPWPLTVTGRHHGATFTLTLPLQPGARGSGLKP